MANISTDFSVWSTVEASNQPDTSDPNTIPADMRAIQAALRTIFPNVDAALTPTHTELNYVDGVTSAIQTQLNSKANLAGATFTNDISVPDEAYGAGWNASLEVPTKNAVYDKIESLSFTSNSISQLNTSIAVTDTGTDGKITKTVDGVVIGEETGAARTSTIDGGSTLYPEFKCRAWATFTGTGTVSLNGSGNIASLTDGGTGIYALTFTTAMPDVNYCIDVSSTLSIGSRQGGVTCSIGAKSTTGFTIYTSNSGASAQDHEQINVSVFR